MEEDITPTDPTADELSELDRVAGVDRAVPHPEATAQDQDAPETTDIALGIWDQVVTFAETLLRPWAAYQVLIALILMVIATALALIFQPKLYDWLKSREGWPKWRYRYAMMVHRRMALIFFTLLIWFTVWVMRAVTWPSRSYLLVELGNLALAWLFVVVVLRVVQNTTLRAILRYGAWIWVTLVLTGLRDDAVQLMDSMSLTFGETRISLWMMAQAILMLGATFVIARLAARQADSRLSRSEDISPSMRVLFGKLLQVFLYTAAFFVGLRIIGFDLRGLAFLTGFVGVGLGFGLQKVVSNLVSGLIILMDKSIKPGDVISLGETFGWINSLGARYVSVVTRDGREFLIPNEDLITNQVVNWSHSDTFVRLDIYFGTAYDDDPHLVRDVAVTAAKSVGRVLTYPNTPVCHIVGFGDSSVDYILRFWIKDPTGGLTNIRGNVYLALWDAFKEHNISLPFPQREVRMLEDSTPKEPPNQNV
ncbi:mechanosensitive ion channel family protein [Shimia sp. MMG029]|uniref:mechanosensitive ion channel family protein n=1 Tax=Shimia sp. MMG029 TaxID=3021978 RepID=UPI0022FF152E|nr:mechanosensitive ion channel domain-containing protein [Shimia sp. MMG029]MDA5557550.1 mechanosensitive ion channel [Shimia sp. MMG029]